MRFGLTHEEFDLIRSLVVEPLRLKDAQVYVYGSRARGDHQAFSDLDLMVESSDRQSLQLGGLAEALQKSNFPYKVDLVHLEDFAEAYRPSYEKDKVLFPA